MIHINENRKTGYREWGVKDVKQLILDRNIRFKNGNNLTDEECFKVLKLALNRNDDNEGINYDVLEFWLFSLFRSRIINARSIHGWYR